MKYNNETLINYCNENNIQLLEDYSNNKITRECYINGLCININCKNEFNKNFRQLIKTGAYCKSCMDNVASLKIKNAKVKYDLNVLSKYCIENNIILINDCNNKYEYVNRDSIIKGICISDNCKNIFIKPLRQLLKIGGYCEECSIEKGKAKIIETNLNKIGVDNPMKNEEIKFKFKQGILQKYGVEYISQIESVKQKIKEKMFEKYGVEYALQVPEIREQIKQTNILKYGVENPQQNKDIKEKTMNTVFRKYGVKCYLQTDEFREKVIQTNMEKYGVPHHSQNPEIAEKMLQNAYKRKQYKMPSGNIITIQGYENFMLDYLLFVENISQDDIITNRKYVPEIWIIDESGERHRHYVDFYIKSQNRCIEVKSTFTNQKKNFVFEKQQAGKDLGYKYEIWVFNEKGHLLEKYI